jgi:trans-2,3-dihydro-3-hydroxyanthranilate isomerase
MPTKTYAYLTVDVFTDRPFAGNPLAVVPDARGLTTEQMQAIAAEFNYSETTFVLPPDDPAHTAKVRIFNRTSELPFAGHPNVGTAYVLGLLAERSGTPASSELVFEEIAGIVPVEIVRDASGRVQGATLTAPQPLSVGEKVDVTLVAACIGVAATAVITRRHAPMHASVGLPFVFAEVTPEALGAAKPDIAAFTAAAAKSASMPGRFNLHVYARPSGAAACAGEPDLRARMFAPLSGTFEDPATGSANSALGALLASLAPERDLELTLRILQGAEMGRPSMLTVAATKQGGSITRVRAGGRCAPVMEGTLTP